MPDALSHDLRPPEANLAATANDCVRCGYALLGIEDDAPCPECGLLAERSRRLDGHLSNATPGWLRGISVGVALVLLAHVLAVAWLFLSPTIVQLLQPSYVWNGATVVMTPSRLSIDVDPGVVVAGGFTFTAILLFAGLWLLTRPQHRHASDPVLGWLLRAASLAPFVAIGIPLFQAYEARFIGYVPGRDRLYAIVVMLVLTVGCAPIPALMFLLLRRLARRVLHPGLAEHAAIVGVGLSATLVAIPLILLAIEIGDRHGGTHWATRSSAALMLMLFGSVAFVLFAGWSALNCLRFAFAFRRAYRGALRKWRDADRSSAAD